MTTGNCKECERAEGAFPKVPSGAGVPPVAFKIDNSERPMVFHKVVIATSLGDDSTYPATPGLYYNALVEYEANGAVYLYSSEGVPTQLQEHDAGLKTDIDSVKTRVSAIESTLLGDLDLTVGYYTSDEWASIWGD